MLSLASEWTCLPMVQPVEYLGIPNRWLNLEGYLWIRLLLVRFEVSDVFLVVLQQHEFVPRFMSGSEWLVHDWTFPWNKLLAGGNFRRVSANSCFVGGLNLFESWTVEMGGCFFIVVAGSRFELSFLPMVFAGSVEFANILLFLFISLNTNLRLCLSMFGQFLMPWLLYLIKHRQACWILALLLRRSVHCLTKCLGLIRWFGV